jgi:nitrogenase iron protein NifH
VSAEHLIMVGRTGGGKSTTAANLAAALTDAGKRVLLVGYDPRGNSSPTLPGIGSLQPLPDWKGCLGAPRYALGSKNSLCVEGAELVSAGDPAYLLRHPIVAGFNPDFVIHDVFLAAGESLALPSATEGVARLFAITSADMGAINAVNDLFAWLNTVAAVDYRFGGVIVNNLTEQLYQSIVADFVAQTNTSIVANIPHSLMISVSDFYNQTLIESAPNSRISFVYRKLARLVLEPNEVRRPGFLQRGALRQWAVKWGEIVGELENGSVQDGSNI